MTSGGVFALLLISKKTDAYFNALDQLYSRLEQIKNNSLQSTKVKLSRIFANSELKKNEDGTFPSEAEQAAFLKNKTEFIQDSDSFAKKYIDKNYQWSSLDQIRSTHRFAINNYYKPFVPVNMTYIRCNDRKATDKFGSTSTFTFPTQWGDTVWVNDIVLHLKLEGFAARSTLDKVKCAEFLGHRIIENAEIHFNNTLIQSIGTEDYNYYYTYEVSENQKLSYLRCIGQEIPNISYVVPDPNSSNIREYRYIADGPQTFKSSHDVIDLWIPLIFWFNKKIGNSLPVRLFGGTSANNSKSSYTPIEISIKFRAFNQIGVCADRGGGGRYTEPRITANDLYLNHVTTVKEVYQSILSDYTMTFIRTNKCFEIQTQDYKGCIELKQLRAPIESLAIATRLIANDTNVDLWHLNYAVTVASYRVPTIVDSPVPNSFAISSALYFQRTNILTKCGIKINTVDLFPTVPVEFYLNYMNFASELATKDNPWIFFKFTPNLIKKMPYGYINPTENRELYFDYEADPTMISSTSKAKFIFVAKLLNYVIIKNGQITLAFA